ncbi:MAG: pyruvate, phosphate dikinase [Deltaproteobacteria bacterium]|nr:pyruvate, phosphate dikinase [Deltaproteobacteria bacterium]
MKEQNWVYFFGGGKAEGNGRMKDLLGGKGAGLAEMTLLGIPVPPGFTLTTEVCTSYTEKGGELPAGLEKEAREKLEKVEKIMEATFGDRHNPLLVSVRSGARVSMPGMMDTVLNLGLNDETVQGLAEKTENPRFAYDSYRRFIQMYANVVLGLDSRIFERLLEYKKELRPVKLDTELTAADLQGLVQDYKKKIEESGKLFPQDPWVQLWEATTAVFRSWNNKRAIEYRRIHKIPNHWGTAANVQAMVFGNMGEDSATGVAFTRDPSTGEKRFFGEYLINAQGEDVVAGIRTPKALNQTTDSLEKTMPEVYQELTKIYQKLEKHYRDMQDIEFTVQKRRLWLLQTRNGKRTAPSAVKIAVDMVREGLIDEKTAILRVEPSLLDQLLHPMIDPKASKKVLARGLPASPGAAVGSVVFTADEAQAAAELGEKVILVRLETSPEDIHGMHAAVGILTARGGMTSHAAVVARGMGKCCIVGCGEMDLNVDKDQFTIGSTVVRKGETITLNGSSGEVMLGVVPTILPELSSDFATLMGWVDKVRRLKVRANADTATDSRVARNFGAEGIGLCRTEHMFFEPDRIEAVREMILAEDEGGRRKALAKILPMQKGDFLQIFEVMAGLPVTIRLLDPPLHEFLPHTGEEIGLLSKNMGVPVERLKAKLESLREFNPMLGHRGCRLGISYPEIYEMQVVAIMEAACELVQRKGLSVKPEIEIPLVGHASELQVLRNICRKVADQVMAGKRQKIDYKIGTMIELPRAAMTADEIAPFADFFSFGTNDLTQTTLGFSRDDVGKFLHDYLEQGLLDGDPFVSLDLKGVGVLMQLCVDKAREIKPTLEVGICGEHGGDPVSVEFCHRIGLNYVSCSPYRVPVARLAAAHAALKETSVAETLKAD